MTVKQLNVGDVIHVVTYGRNPDSAPELYITVPEAGLGVLIKAPATLGILMFGGPDTLTDIAQTLVFRHLDTAEADEELAASHAERFGAEVGDLNPATIAEFPDMVCFTTTTLTAALNMVVRDAAIAEVPPKPTGEGYVEG